MSWQQLHFVCDKTQTDLAEALLLEEGAVSILLEDAGDEPLFEPLPNETPLWSNVIVSAFFDTHTTDDFATTDFESIATEIATAINASRFWLTTLDDKDWTKEWMSHYKPIQCKANLWIVPQWLDAPDPSAINLILDPGLAFGTGYHATTRLCLDWLAEQDLTDKVVLDYGCGSGILGVGALLLGAKKVLAVDIDPQAILATHQNAQLNGVADRLQVFLPDEFNQFINQTPTTIDTIVANILAKPLIGLAPYFDTLCTQNTTIVLAGLIQSQVDEVLTAYRPYFKMDAPFCYDNDNDRHWHRLSGVHLS